MMEAVLQGMGVGKRSIDDAFFEDSYRACKIFQRKGVTAVDDEELCHEVMKEFSCHASGCTATFQSLLAFEMHYNRYHQYVCAECKKSHPNPRLLDMHIQETHDSFFKVLSAKQPMYECYDSECILKFNEPIERSTHCVQAHKFPKHFRFDVVHYSKKREADNKMDVDKPNDERNKERKKQDFLNKTQKVRTFTGGRAGMVVKQPNTGTAQLNLPNSSKGTSLIFVPRQVQTSYAKALTQNKSSERNVIETESMMELAECLPE